MKKLTLSWDHNGTGGLIENPLWSDILEALDMSRCGYGSVSIDLIDSDSYKNLETIYESKLYLIHFGFDIGSDWIVKSYYDESTLYPDKEIEICGDYWCGKNICRDFIFVKSIFFTFFKTGTIPYEMLNKA